MENQDGKQAEEKKSDDPPPESPRKKPSKGRLIIIGATVLGLILAAGVILWIRGRTRESTDDAYVTAHVHQISARVSGTVEAVLVDDNDVVTEGQPLLRLDARDYEVALQKAQAGLGQAVAQTAQARAQIAESHAKELQAEAQMSQAEAQTSQAGAQLEVASVNFNRNRSLFQKDARAVAKAEVDTTKANFDAAQGAFDAAKAMFQATRANAEAVRAGTRSAEAQVAVAEASEKTAEAAVREAGLQLSYVTVLAPVGGRVARKTVERGQRLAPGQALMAVVASNVWLLANYKETQLGHIRVGDRVEIQVDALPGRDFTGRVDSIQAGSGATFALLPPDNATGNFTKIVQRVPVKIVFDAESIRGFESRLVAGLSAEPTVRISGR